jgi:hypothetical protein
MVCHGTHSLAAHFQETGRRLTMLGLIRAQGGAGRMPNVAKMQPSANCGRSDTAALLLEWWDRERRDLPWRTPPGCAPDPYRVWLSEIMLQQTTVRAVIPFYERFLARWPTVAALAAAPLDEVLAAWAGLGYYSRARNLHKCAKLIADAHGGRFPTTSGALVKLPGIGPYTAAALAAISPSRRQRPSMATSNVWWRACLPSQHRCQAAGPPCAASPAASLPRRAPATSPRP